MPRPVDELRRRFGLPESAFAGLDSLVAQDTVFVGTPEAIRFRAVRPLRRGIRLCRIFPHSVKPTTWAMQILGRHATRNCIELSREQVVRLISSGQLELDALAANGFVIIRCEGLQVGVGLYKRPLLKSQIPRYRPVEE